MGVRLPKMTQWLQKWPLMKQKTYSGVLRKLKVLAHLSITSECLNQQHGALGWRNSRPGFCPLPAYFFIWKYHCKIYISRAGGDAWLQPCWWFSPHQCQLSSCLRRSLGRGTGPAACTEVSLLGQAATPQAHPQLLRSPKFPLHMADISAAGMEVMWMCNSICFFGSFRRYQRVIWRCKNPHILIIPIFQKLSLCNSPLAEF